MSKVQPPEYAPPVWMHWTLPALVWAAVLLTIYSGAINVIAANRILVKK